MSDTARVSIPSQIWEWLLSIGTTSTLSEEDNRKIASWRLHTQRPSVEQIKRYSRKLHVPFGYFFLEQPIDDVPAVFAHRTVGSREISKPSRDLVDTVNDMTAIQQWSRQDLIDSGEGGNFHT